MPLSESALGNISVEAAPVPESPLGPVLVTTLPDTEKKPPIRVVVKTDSIQNHHTTTNELPGDDGLPPERKDKLNPFYTQTGGGCWEMYY